MGIAVGVYWLHSLPTAGHSNRIAATVGLRPLSRSALKELSCLVPLSFILGLSLVLIVLRFAGPFPFPIPVPEGALVEKIWTARPISFLVYAVVVGPAIEELGFRGWMQKSLIRGLGAAGGILTTSTLFALLHLWYAHPAGAVVPFGLALVWGGASCRFGSVYAGVVLHGGWNLLLLLLAWRGLNETVLMRATADPLRIGLIVVLAGAVAYLLWTRLVALERLWSRHAP